MNLKNQLEVKLREIQSRLDNTKKAFKCASELVQDGLNLFSYSNPTRNVFAKYSFTLEEILISINHLEADINVYNNYKEFVLNKEESMIKVLDLFEDRVTDTLTTLQATTIFLENLKKET